MNIFSILVGIALLLTVCSLIWPSNATVLHSVALILMCAAMLAAGTGVVKFPPS